MHIDPLVALAGLVVGFTVGLTGMGGGALMTPILVLLFRVQPLAAVSSDLVAAVIMKPVGGGVHLRRGTVNKPLVKWLMIGSIPSAFVGVLVLKHMGNGAVVQDRIKIILGCALVMAAGSVMAKAVLQARQARRDVIATAAGLSTHRPFQIKPLPTVIIGVLGGLVVGMTSVGSGSLIIVMLLVLYPMLSMKELVGTDLVQAIPLVASAAFGHILFGDFKLALTASLLVGSIPGVYFGARVSSRAKDVVVRPILAFVLVASGLKLLNLGTLELGLVMLAIVLMAVPVWGALDAYAHADEIWAASGRSKRLMVRLQGGGAPLGVGFIASMFYFGVVRPKLMAQALLVPVTVTPDPALEHAGVA